MDGPACKSAVSSFGRACLCSRAYVPQLARSAWVHVTALYMHLYHADPPKKATRSKLAKLILAAILKNRVGPAALLNVLQGVDESEEESNDSSDEAFDT